MKYAVIVPCYNEEANLQRCLPAIAAARGGRVCQVRLVDNGSTDRSPDLAASLGADVKLSPKRISIAALRNLGAEGVDADILIFLDADMEVPPDWFDHLDRAFDAGGADAVGFVESIPASAPWYAVAWSLRTVARRDKPRPADFLPGRNIAVRRSFFERSGGFSDALLTSEDKDFVLRLRALGARVFTYPAINLIHWGYERTAYELARKEFWRQGSHIAMLRRHGASLRLLRFPFLALLHLVGWSLLPVAIILGVPWLSVPFWLSWLPSLGLVLVKPISRSDPLLVMQLLLLYHLRFIIAGVSILYELISGRGAVDYVRS